MRLVVDASVAVKWLVNEENSDVANTLRFSEHNLHAPRFLEMELGNTLWQKSRRGQITRSEASDLVDQIVELPVRWMNTDPLIPDAIRLALDLNHPVYDCVYLALARRMDAAVVTADARFVSALAGTPYERSVMTLRQFAS